MKVFRRWRMKSGRTASASANSSTTGRARLSRRPARAARRGRLAAARERDPALGQRGTGRTVGRTERRAEAAAGFAGAEDRRDLAAVADAGLVLRIRRQPRVVVAPGRRALRLQHRDAARERGEDDVAHDLAAELGVVGDPAVERPHDDARRAELLHQHRRLDAERERDAGLVAVVADHQRHRGLLPGLERREDRARHRRVADDEAGRQRQAGSSNDRQRLAPARGAARRASPARRAGRPLRRGGRRSAAPSRADGSARRTGSARWRAGTGPGPAATPSARGRSARRPTGRTRVTCAGSPPNDAMWRRTQCSAAIWSSRPKFAGAVRRLPLSSAGWTKKPSGPSR